MTKDAYFMQKAYEQALKAKEHDEVPIGAVIVQDGKIIARAYNQKEHQKSATAHAEMIAITKASKKLDNWHLNGCTMYVTLEPCPMCASAIMQSRIEEVVFGALDEKSGAIISNPNLLENDRGNYKTKYRYLLDDEKYGKIITDYFKSKR